MAEEEGAAVSVDDLAYDALLEWIADEVAPYVGDGRVADYIPALAEVPPDRFGMALATVDGRVYGVGDYRERFSLQSISKVYSLALVMARDAGILRGRVGVEPSGNAFNSLIQLEYERGIPRNPFINAGALVVTDLLQTLTGDAAGAVLELLRTEADDHTITIDGAVAASEAEHGHLNLALAHFMAAYGNIENPVDVVVDHYFRHCSIAMSCAEAALATLFLARHGVRGDGSRLLPVLGAKRVNALMMTCGAYDAAGEFAFRVGLPAKSGVGGGIVAVLPGRGALCVWSPALDRHGNSVAGVEALDRFTSATGWSVF
ncbi:MAG: glutaminase [Catenulispora sp.]